MTRKTEVLIVGAGPTGLVLAIWLTKQGIAVRIVDKNDGPGSTSRAMTVQARTLELYRQAGLAEEVVGAGYRNPALNMWSRGEKRATLSFGDAGTSLTPYPFMLVYPQDHHERLLVEHLKAAGVFVERRTELVDFNEQGEGVVARLRLPDGTEEICNARYIAGCDGARSAVRHAIGAQFPGGTYEKIFYVADVDASGPAHGDTHLAFEGSDFVLLMSYRDEKKYRLIGAVDDKKSATGNPLTFDDIGHGVIEGLSVTIETVNWFSTYRVHHRVSDRFRRGRAFLLGDAAHVHSPAGGQGMNTGIGDAINLAWKLAAVLRSRASDGLLDSFEAERRAFALTLVDTTDRLFRFVTAEGHFADFVRTRIAPLFASVAYSSEHVREFMFRILSQAMLTYRDGPLAGGQAGKVHGGDRLPWVAGDRGTETDNYEPLPAIGWQVHVYGTANADLAEWCQARGIALRVFSWSKAHREAGLQEDAAYLLRPDTYVALAHSDASVTALEAYARAHDLMFPKE